MIALLQDDVSSTVSTLQDDSQSDTPTSALRRGMKSKRAKAKLRFKCTNWIKVIFIHP